ncbi:concanavalin A-like lectin/glucanase [Massarina eburnea CBS 473.64]|uniref:Concanavalin A-like lectin/glucanase n=1 Tax=Massarina eburnea CBS 473.64 TaxID=1395130 RepID=A0A6A6RM41_9PLEO|nr:concanavalin A-like lectin/glucanase [Massarina eburnea CBS 473.64]
MLTPIKQENNARTPASNTPAASNTASKDNSRRPSAVGADAARASGAKVRPRPRNDRFFTTRRITRGEAVKPWLQNRDPREKWVTIIPIMGVVAGLILGGFLVWDGLRSVTNYRYCTVLDENFSNGLDGTIWQKEVEVGGYGNGQFEMTTADDENVFVKDGILTIKPTLQDKAIVENNGVTDLRGNGCTGTKWSDCLIATNTTNGTIVNPVKSGRVNTKLGASIKFGRVEVVAKLPAGDWIWPAIWMLPKDQVYGEWPRSGEIDIMESRGNNYTYAQGGNNIASSTLHFGPNDANDGWWRNNVKRKVLHTSYAKGFHTFGVEWSTKYIFTYIDSRLIQVMYTRFAEPFWDYGRFPLSDSNGTRLDNPWAGANDIAAPFNQDFYLVLNVAIGGTNGWFEDGKSGKPWIDSSPTAKRDFWQARDSWYPTWEESGTMEVKSVKIWQQSGWNGCKA